MNNKEIESRAYHDKIWEKSVLNNKDYFSNNSIEMMSENIANHFIELIEHFIVTKKAKEWEIKLMNRIKDIKLII